MKLSCSAGRLASGGPPADSGGAVCSDQHVELHAAGVHPASPWISGNSTDLHWEDDWWHDEVWTLHFVPCIKHLHKNWQTDRLTSFPSSDSCLYWWSLEQLSSVASTTSTFLMSSLHVLAGRNINVLNFLDTIVSAQRLQAIKLFHQFLWYSCQSAQEKILEIKENSAQMCWLCGATNMSSCRQNGAKNQI